LCVNSCSKSPSKKHQPAMWFVTNTPNLYVQQVIGSIHCGDDAI
jgi:hypothetical protein